MMIYVDERRTRIIKAIMHDRRWTKPLLTQRESICWQYHLHKHKSAHCVLLAVYTRIKAEGPVSKRAVPPSDREQGRTTSAAMTPMISENESRPLVFIPGTSTFMARRPRIKFRGVGFREKS